jgi:hypothetical protein
MLDDEINNSIQFKSKIHVENLNLARTKKTKSKTNCVILKLITKI